MREKIMNIKISLIIMIIFINGASVLPIISGNSGELRGILFEDNFDDNMIDTTKWSEIHNQGIWWEINEICQLYLIGPGVFISEGIESTSVQISVSQDLPLIISVDTNTKVSSNTEEGLINFRIDAGSNWLRAAYDRVNNDLMIKDSNDADWTIIGNRGDGIWNNRVIIYPDRYYVQMDGFNSGWINDSLFSTSTQLNVELYIELETSSGKYLNVGFDNAKIEIENRPPEQPSQPSGPQKGKTGKSLTYKTSSTDPDGDQVFFLFDWDDDTSLEWVGPYESGTTVSISHTWNTKGFYQIKVKSKDIWGDESDWSDPLEINLPRSRTFNSNFLTKLIEHFQNLFPILRNILNSYNYP